jgi:hypothetical protein
MNWNALGDPVFRLFGACAFFAAMGLASAAQAAPPSAGMWKVQVKSVVMDSRSNQPIVVLEDKKNGRILPIWIGPAEARAIMMQLEGIHSPRPMTHDLLRNMIEGLKARVIRVIITELRSGTFYAQIEIKSSDRQFFIDSRPSDAIALALRTRSPIFVKSEVLSDEVAGISIPMLTHRKRLGIVLQAMSPSLARFFGGSGKGLLVSQVTKGSAGDRSGLRRGDVILEVEGENVSTVRRFEKKYPEYPGGFNVTVRRGKNDSKIRLRLVPEDDGSAQIK